MEQPQFNMMLRYDDIAEYLFEELTELGYVPEGEEILDLTDIVFDFIMQFMVESGVSVFMMEATDESEGDE